MTISTAVSVSLAKNHESKAAANHIAEIDWKLLIYFQIIHLGTSVPTDLLMNKLPSQHPNLYPPDGHVPHTMPNDLCYYIFREN